MFDPEAALRPDAPRIHAQFPGNLRELRVPVQAGDVDRAFREADAVVEGTYRLNYVTTACLGTMAAIAAVGPPRAPDDVVDHADPVPLPARPGGGARHLRRPHPGHPAAGRRQLRPRPGPLPDRHHRGAPGPARRSRPVKIVFDREEEFLASPTREPCVFTLRTAARADGTLLARDARVVIDNGAYVSWGSTTPYVMMTTLAGFYRCPNIRFDTDDRLHEQRLLRLDAGLRQPRVHLRRRGADGRPRRAARARPPRDPAAQREPPGRRDAPGAPDHHAARSPSASTRSRATSAGPSTARRGPAGRAASATPACSTWAAARASTAPTAAAPS